MPSRVLAHAHIDFLGYDAYLELAAACAEARAGERLPDLVLTTTHPPVVTLGRDAGSGESELRLPAGELASRGIDLRRVDRGGRATYHGPGQLMVYPVVKLGSLGLAPADFAGALLQAARRAIDRLGLPRGLPVTADKGLWAGPRLKLASMGLSVRGGVTSHGLALNLEPEPGLGFGAVFPCGEAATRMVDLLTLTGRRLDRRAVARAITEALAEVLGLRRVPLAAEELRGQKPPWLVVPRAAPGSEAGGVGAGGAVSTPATVCAAADCPNQETCAASGRVTYLLLGPTCTRACAFCRVPDGGRPQPPDPDEPLRVALAVARAHGAPGGPGAPGPGRAGRVVLTSVTRDDLPDGGAGQFVATVRAIRQARPGVGVEVLVPDFRGKPGALGTVLAARPDVLGHNLETVPRLYRAVRPGADYGAALGLVGRAAASGIAVRSGVLLGLGEDAAEVIDVLGDLKAVGCRLLWLGQYLRPTPAHLPVARYATPAEFERLAARARRMGFDEVAAGPLVRSSCWAPGH